jgi:hypothetical protein
MGVDHGLPPEQAETRHFRSQRLKISPQLERFFECAARGHRIQITLQLIIL